VAEPQAAVSLSPAVWGFCMPAEKKFETRSSLFVKATLYLLDVSNLRASRSWHR
jgi:hypothetical protein